MRRIGTAGYEWFFARQDAAPVITTLVVLDWRIRGLGCLQPDPDSKFRATPQGCYQGDNWLCFKRLALPLRLMTFPTRT
jgi:hypothetical protein